jgi:lipopolysaccharide export system permease protein
MLFAKTTSVKVTIKSTKTDTLLPTIINQNQKPMKKIDRLILGEIIGPWMFGVAIFTVLIMAGSFLFTFTRFLTLGIPIGMVIQLTILLLPGILAKTFSMAMLLGTLLSFGRLSGDSEIVALRAGGVSIIRIMAPVAAFGLFVSVLTHFFTDYVVPAASFQASAMRQKVESTIDSSQLKETSQPIHQDGKLKGYLIAENFNLADRTLSGVKIYSYDDTGATNSIFEVERLEFDDLEKWRAIGEGQMIFINPSEADPEIRRVSGKLTLFEGAWPEGVPRPTESPEDMSAPDQDDLDVFSSRDIKRILREKADDGTLTKAQQINLEFGYWNKFALPLAALIFGLVGAPLGIRSHRAGNATGFWLSVIIIFGYMLVTNTMSIAAQNGAIPAWLASFGPVAVGGIVAIELIRRKNRQ